ncbi:hypothetical protein [Methylobacterium iners]|jgi:hypothetical protein|uniref:Uncharacterized protein n=1 Tax=Methylobacterium iners TaxID=418707 RepID=A0ABQ4RYK1_9HYPH|nr:hypothetical protein [Methylobacterium iners]GJD94647.1 hypothetical protein OCOJLMKI_1850 [Methylobacterium iners]
MPDFIAALLTAATFCIGLMALNALTRLGIQWQITPSDLAEGGMVQYAGALALAGMTWRRSLRRPV